MLGTTSNVARPSGDEQTIGALNMARDATHAANIVCITTTGNSRVCPVRHCCESAFGQVAIRVFTIRLKLGFMTGRYWLPGRVPTLIDSRPVIRAYPVALLIVTRG